MHETGPIAEDLLDARDNHPSQGADGGWCNCELGWVGSDCSTKQCPVHNGQVCNGQGVCNAQTGQCECRFPYHSSHRQGGACELKFCPGTKLAPVGRSVGARPLFAKDYTVCSGHGECMHETGPIAEDLLDARDNHPSQGADGGWCNCELGWVGSDCSTKQCPVHNGQVCNGQGVCNAQTGQCECSAAYFGTQCELKHCPDAVFKFNGNPPARPLEPSDFVECSSRGVCDYSNGVCGCSNSTHGPHCEFKQCPKAETGFVCSGEGVCDQITGHCNCFEGSTGSACQETMCPMDQNALECGGAARGKCDRSTGHCNCVPPYSKYDCSGD
eukprot:TRINITY_DN1002_c0_g1_i1.p1 TRINITY_DN1002_c0_g1~~TRINITY_DN1002_c0_g1_i1.p1  ORF type:complete len:328 (-),score=22.78 TRINITY_DN1002_c0_g1_i1:109-1092(-)